MFEAKCKKLQDSINRTRAIGTALHNHSILAKPSIAQRLTSLL